MKWPTFLLLAVCGLQPCAVDAAPAHVGWPGYNNGYDSGRYSPLTEINVANAARLNVVCNLKITDAGAFQAGPVVIGETMYVTAAHTTVALNAATCVERWRADYAPDAPEAAPVNRGVAFLDGRLY